jgi:hypothetical protein
MLEVQARVRAAHLKEAEYETTFTILTKQDEAKFAEQSSGQKKGNRTSS